MDHSTIICDKVEGVAKITLNRPDKLNAFSEVMHQELARALDCVELDRKIRAILITGAGRGFCTGQDLNDRAMVSKGDGAPDIGASLDRYYNPLTKRLQTMRRPVICAVNGVAAGAGANLALACDIVIAARSASFIQAFVKIGLIPDAGGTFMLPRLVGHARAMGLAMLGEPLSAEQAKDIGMIWDVVDDEDLMPHAEALATRLAKGPTTALGNIKTAINASAGQSLDDQLDLERDLQKHAGASEDFKEGIAAFLARRAPNFQGR